MKLIHKIEKTGNLLFPFESGVFVSKRKSLRDWKTNGLYFIDENATSLKYDGAFSYGVQVNDFFVWQPSQGKDLYYSDKMFKIHLIRAGEIYFDSIQFSSKIKNNLIFEQKIGAQFFCHRIQENGAIFPIQRIYQTETDEFLLSVDNGYHNIYVYNKNESLQWSLNLERELPPFATPKRFQGRHLLANDQNVFVPIENGQLIALNIQNGNIRWLTDLQTPLGGNYELMDNNLYRNTGQMLMVIDAITGKITHELNYRSIGVLKNMFSFAGDFKVTQEFLFMKDNILGWVIQLDRSTLELVEFVPVGCRLPSCWDGALFWYPNMLYVVDTEKSMLKVFQ
ncbi:MAG: hypothetical protein RLZZ628_1503 [Bacteroidota bacterium]|jgi:hypothetical protein